MYLRSESSEFVNMGFVLTDTVNSQETHKGNVSGGLAVIQGQAFK